jgi:sugar phosphate isomerase/epimerase
MHQSISTCTRRTWLTRATTGALATLGAVVLDRQLSGAEGATVAPPAASSGGQRLAGLRLSVNAYSFHRRLGAKGPGSMTLDDVMDFCVAHDVAAIDPTGYFFDGYPAAPSDVVLNEFKRGALRRGLAISGTGIRNDFVTADSAIRAEGVARAKVWIDVAARLGAPVLRVFAGAEPAGIPPEEVMKWLVDALRECAEYGQRQGVVVGVQNHGDFLQTAARCNEVVAKVASPWLGVVVDTGNFKVADPYADIALVAPNAVNWQVKESPLGNGNPVRTDIARLMTIIHASGYRGFVPIETIESGKLKDYDPKVEAARLLFEMRAAIGG